MPKRTTSKKEKNEILKTILSNVSINLYLNMSVSEDRNTIHVKLPDINLIIQKLKEKINEKYFRDIFDIDLDSAFTKNEIIYIVIQQLNKLMMKLNKENINEFIENFK